MSLHNPLERFPNAGSPVGTRQSVAILAVVLVVGLTFVAPALSLLSGLPVLLFVVLVGASYGIICLWLRELFIGSLIGLLVTAMFAADVPLANESYNSLFFGHMGPQIWLAQLPLLTAVAWVLYRQEWAIINERTRIETLFGALVVWTVLSALFGATIHTDVALFFSLLLLQGLIVFSLFRYSVQQQLLSFRSIVLVYIGAVTAQTLFAVAQFFNHDVFGLSSLGEGDGISLSWITLGPLGEYSFGTHVAGFTGMSFHLASLIILAVPLVIGLAIHYNGRWRGLLLGLSVLMTGVLRATTSDGARGGLILTLGLLGILLFCLYRTAWFDSIVTHSNTETAIRTRLQTLGWTTITGTLSLLMLFLPSSTAGNTSNITNISSDSTAIGSSDGSAVGHAQFEAINSLLESLSIPFFNIANLGVRLQQYIAGIDLFIRNPLFGIGGANFAYYSTEYGLSESLPLHSMYFAMLAEAGLPGFFLLIAIIIGFLLTVWKTAKQSTENIIIIGMFCGFIGWFAFAFWDIPTIKITPTFPFWALAGAVAGLYTRSSKSAELHP